MKCEVVIQILSFILMEGSLNDNSLVKSIFCVPVHSCFPFILCFSLSDHFTLSNIVGKIKKYKKNKKQESWINRLHPRQTLCGSYFCQRKNRVLSSPSHKGIFICVTVNGNVVSLFSLRERVLSMLLICAYRTLFPKSILVCLCVFCLLCLFSVFFLSLKLY